MQEIVTYPFSAIVSLDNLKLALILNAINPQIGGLLIRGPKGSGKTTTVRALADILPKIKVVKGCPFNCNPEDPSNMCDKCKSTYMKKGALSFEEKKMKVVDLPLGATEDRVVGSIDVEKAVKMGVEALEPGILAQANQNILYVDEVNLLPDHIADDLLDAAATGWNVVEREGISVKHPSRFIFIGTMNPEEGSLRPQLLDRFPLSVEVKRISDVNDRVEIVKRNMAFEADPEGFIKKYSFYQQELKNKIIQARKILSEVKIPEKFIEVICKACLELKVDGMRPDIIIAKTAKTLAAFENKTVVTLEHILRSAELALNHRTREGGFLEPATPEEIKKVFMDKIKEAERKDRDSSRSKLKIEKSELKKHRVLFWPKKINKKEKKPLDRCLKKPVKRFKKAIFTLDKLFRGAISKFTKHEAPKEARALNGVTSAQPREINEGFPLISKISTSILAPFKLFFEIKKPPRGVRGFVGKRAETVTKLHRGRTFGWRFPEGKPRDIHIPATIRAAARAQRSRKARENIALDIHFEDIREKLRLYRAPMTIIFVLDLSESMFHCIDEVKEAVLKLHTDAYHCRDKVGIVAFKGTGATVVQYPTTNLKVVANKLLRLRMSGFTPLAAGMLKALEVLKASKRRDPSIIPVMVILTDGEANVPLRKDLRTGAIREFDVLDVAFFKYEDKAFRDVVSVSRIIKKEGIYTVVINPVSTLTGSPSTSGHILIKMIASITDGVYHEVSRGIIRHGKKEPAKEISDTILQAQRQIAHTHYLTHKVRIK